MIDGAIHLLSYDVQISTLNSVQGIHTNAIHVWALLQSTMIVVVPKNSTAKIVMFLKLNVTRVNVYRL